MDYYPAQWATILRNGPHGAPPHTAACLVCRSLAASRMLQLLSTTRLTTVGEELELRTTCSSSKLSVMGFCGRREPASDLAVAIAIASSYYDRGVPQTMAAVGEMGLAGELRCVRECRRQ